MTSPTEHNPAGNPSLQHAIAAGLPLRAGHYSAGANENQNPGFWNRQQCQFPALVIQAAVGLHHKVIRRESEDGGD